LTNPNGNPSALIPAPHGNTRALRHGAYSERFSIERHAQIVGELMGLPHVKPLDLPAAHEIAALMLQAERVDPALADGCVESKRGQLRALLEHR
jgi:hypothetical protein